MKTHIVLLTHAVTDWHLKGKTQGHIDIPLNDYGKKMAEYIAEKLKDESIGAIYTSDLQRAYETAIPLAKIKGLDICKRSDLREGRWKVKNDSSYPQLKFYCENENLNTIKFRMANAITEIAKNHLGQEIVIISHEGAVRQFIKFVVETSQEYPIKYKGIRCSINRFGYEDGYWQCIILNDGDFLREVPKSSIRFLIIYFILEIRSSLMKMYNKVLMKL